MTKTEKAAHNLKTLGIAITQFVFGLAALAIIVIIVIAVLPPLTEEKEALRLAPIPLQSRFCIVAQGSNVPITDDLYRGAQVIARNIITRRALPEMRPYFRHHGGHTSISLRFQCRSPRDIEFLRYTERDGAYWYTFRVKVNATVHGRSDAWLQRRRFIVYVVLRVQAGVNDKWHVSSWRSADTG